jgi:hypothetical protein
MTNLKRKSYPNGKKNHPSDRKIEAVYFLFDLTADEKF